MSSFARREEENVARQNSEPPATLLAEAAEYVIVVDGRLDPGWSEYVAGMSIDSSEQAHGGVVSTLCGTLPDQAALFGVLNHLYNLGFRLLQVEMNGTRRHHPQGNHAT